VDDEAKPAECILNQAADAVIFADRSGKIARWNRASALLFGFSTAEALGQSLDLIVPGHLRTAHWRGLGLSRCRAASAKCGRLKHCQAAATAVRQVSIAAARSVRCVWAEMRWRWTLKVL
jgi:PAS domain S-box-containing protein